MGKKDALGSLTGRGEGTKGAEGEVGLAIDWIKVRRVQHGLSRPRGTNASSSYGFVSYEELEVAETRSRRAMRLAHVLAFVTGVLLGIASLRSLAEEPVLLAAAILTSLIGVLAAHRAHLLRET